MNDQDLQEVVTQVYNVMEIPKKIRPTFELKQGTGEYVNDEKKVLQRARKGGVASHFLVNEIEDDEAMLQNVLHEITHVLRPAKEDKTGVLRAHYGGFFRLAAKLYRYFGLPEEGVLARETAVYPTSERYIKEVYASTANRWFVHGMAIPEVKPVEDEEENAA